MEGSESPKQGAGTMMWVILGVIFVILCTGAFFAGRTHPSGAVVRALVDEKVAAITQQYTKDKEIQGQAIKQAEDEIRRLKRIETKYDKLLIELKQKAKEIPQPKSGKEVRERFKKLGYDCR